MKWRSHSSAARFDLERAHGSGRALGLPLFLLATFAGALVAGLSGFAFGLVVSAIWLYILTPLQTATLIIAFGLIVQGYSVWKLRGCAGLAKALAVRARARRSAFPSASAS